MLIQPQNQVTDFTPVTISFVADKGVLRDIHVVDAGGILYPGGNFKFVRPISGSGVGNCAPGRAQETAK